MLPIDEGNVLLMPTRSEENNREIETVFSCDFCGEEIHLGDDYYKINDLMICGECIRRCRKAAV